MAARADAPAAVGGGPAQPLHPRRHALEVVERRVGLGHDQDGAERDQRHRDQVLGRIERQLGVERRVVGVRRVGGDQEGVAVGRRLRDDLRADDGVGAGLRIDQHLLAELRRQRIGDHPHQGIDRAARIERHDDAHRLGRPSRLRPRREWRGEGCGEKDSPLHPIDTPFIRRTFRLIGAILIRTLALSFERHLALIRTTPLCHPERSEGSHGATSPAGIRSFHRGLAARTSSFLRIRFQPLSCFSRAMASSISSNSSA